MFDFRLKVFHTTAKRLSFTKAAEDLFITQPAVTKHIHETERHFNVKLFDRNGTKIKLTDAGVLLLHNTEKLFEVYRDLEFSINELSGYHGGILRIGASTTAAQYILPPILAAFYKRYADVKVVLTAYNTELVEQALERNEIDLGIIEGDSKNASFKYDPFVKDKLVAVVRKTHPLLKKTLITREDLLNTNVLLRESGSGTLEVVANVLKKINIALPQLTVEMQLGSSESMKLYLQNSEAIAFLSIYSIAQELKQEQLAVLDVEGLSIKRYFYFIRRHGQPGQLANTFIDFAISYNFK